MNKFFKLFIIIVVCSITKTNFIFADNTYFIDFTKVLNQSSAGAEAQKKLKQNFERDSKKFQEEENKLKNQESELISLKKSLSNDEYQKKVDELRKSVAKLQKSKQDSFNEIAKTRNDARQELLKAVNPIIKRYMEQNNIRVVINKDSVILGDTSLEITDKIIEILNQELKSLKLN